MKLISFNVNGIRAITKKNFLEDLKTLNPDILCLQETKATAEQVREALFCIDSDYQIFANSAERPGYSGTAVITKQTPLSVSYDMGIEEHDKEGRIITAEYQNFILVNVYTPNSGEAQQRLKYRVQWDVSFLNYIKNLEKKKPVIICGDLNVAHKDIDLANPKENYNKSSGYMQEEIDGMDNYIKNGLLDSFRHFNPELSKAYSWWSYRAGARKRNVGWRIDYFLLSQSIINNVKKAEIFSDIEGSDHCPVGIELDSSFFSKNE